MNRRQKIDFLKKVLAGMPIKAPVLFCQYLRYDDQPGLYMDARGKLITEAEMLAQVDAARQRAEIAWHEVKEYQTQQ